MTVHTITAAQGKVKKVFVYNHEDESIHSFLTPAEGEAFAGQLNQANPDGFQCKAIMGIAEFFAEHEDHIDYETREMFYLAAPALIDKAQSIEDVLVAVAQCEYFFAAYSGRLDPPLIGERTIEDALASYAAVADDMFDKFEDYMEPCLESAIERINALNLHRAA